jgi:hypothetical protein
LEAIGHDLDYNEVMGFRSTFITEDRGMTFKDWFIDKYKDKINFSGNHTPISSKFEIKAYAPDLEKDIKSGINWNGKRKLILIWLHECGGITRVEITENAILSSEPTAWHETHHIEHNYCYGCSDHQTVEEKRDLDNKAMRLYDVPRGEREPT